MYGSLRTFLEIVQLRVRGLLFRYNLLHGKNNNPTVYLCNPTHGIGYTLKLHVHRLMQILLSSDRKLHLPSLLWYDKCCKLSGIFARHVEDLSCRCNRQHDMNNNPKEYWYNLMHGTGCMSKLHVRRLMQIR